MAEKIDSLQKRIEKLTEIQKQKPNETTLLLITELVKQKTALENDLDK